MTAGEIYATAANQHRLILGTTPTGDIGFTTRGGNVMGAWNHCQVQSPSVFAEDAALLRTLNQAQLDAVRADKAGWMQANEVS